MPSGWVVHTFWQLASSAQLFDPLAVQLQGSALLFELDLWSKDLGLSLLRVHEGLSVVCVCA